MTARLRSGALVLAMLLGGCSSAASPERFVSAGDPLRGADLSGVSAAQAGEIEDRTATEEEYRAAFQRYRACLNAAGYDLTEVELTDRVYQFGVPTGAVDGGADTQCYRTEFQFVDVLWQTSGAVG